MYWHFQLEKLQIFNSSAYKTENEIYVIVFILVFVKEIPSRAHELTLVAIISDRGKDEDKQKQRLVLCCGLARSLKYLLHADIFIAF